MNKQLLLLVFSYFIVLNTYAQILISPNTTNATNSAEDVWIQGVRNEFNNPIPITTPSYGNFEVKRLHYGNGFLKIGRGNARRIYNGFNLTNGQCSAGEGDGLITYFNDNNQHQWTAQLGYCNRVAPLAPSPDFGSHTTILDVSTDEAGNVFIVFSVNVSRQFSGAYIPAPITNASSSIVASMHRSTTNSVGGEAPFIVPSTTSGNNYNRTYIAVIRNANTTSPTILVNELNITYPSSTNSASRENDFSNLHIQSDGRGGIGFYISGSSHSTKELQIRSFNNSSNLVLTLPSFSSENTNTTFIVRYNDIWQPAWAKCILTPPISSGTAGGGNPGNQNIDLTVDAQGNPYAYITHLVGSALTGVPIQAIHADQTNPSPSNTILENIGTLVGNSLGRSNTFSLTRFDMLTGAMNWTNTGTNYVGIPNNNNSINSKLAISNGRLYLLGEFGRSDADDSFLSHQTVLSSGVGASRTLMGENITTTAGFSVRNLLVAGYDLNGNLEWARSAEGADERAYTIDVDREGNAYALVGYQNSLTMRPFSVPTTPNFGQALLKISSCGRLFWLENILTSSAFYSNASMCFVNRNQLYTGIQHSANTILRPYEASPIPTSTFFGLGGSEYVIRLADTPLANCAGSGVILRATDLGGNLINPSRVTNWTNSCGVIGNANQTSLTVASNTEGIYSINSQTDPLESNELWISSTPVGADFTIVGISPVCTNVGYTYQVSNVRPGITYNWFLDGSTTAVAINSSSYTASWTNTTTSTLTHTLVVRATDGNCIFERSFVVEVPTHSPEVDASDFSFCPNSGLATTTLHVVRPSSVPLGVPLRYSWTPITGLNNANVQTPTLTLSGITSPTQYEVEVTLLDGTCVGRGISYITLQQPQASLTLPIAEICKTENPIVLSGGSPAGGVYSGQGVTPIMNGGVITGYQFDPRNLLPDEYEITYTYNQNGCSGTAKQPIKVLPPNIYTVSASGCRYDPPLYNPNQEMRVTLNKPLTSQDRIELTINGVTDSYSQGSSWSFTNIPIGTPITVKIITTNPAVNASCGVSLNNNVSSTGSVSTTIVVEESPEYDLYLKDSSRDIGEQPSSGGSSSPSIFWSVAPAPLSSFSNDSYHDNPNTFVNENTWFYYEDTPEYNAVVSHPKGNSVLVGETNYIYIVVFNKGCKPFGKGLAVDAHLYNSNTGVTGTIWRHLISPQENDDNLPLQGGVIRIPQDIQPGQQLIIMKKIPGSLVSSLGGHTCTMARILPCASNGVYNDNCIEETLGQGLPTPQLPTSFSGYPIRYNNVAWKNMNLVSPQRSEGKIVISNSAVIDKIVRVKFNFQNHVTTHYLENNSFELALSSELYARWVQANRVSNNLALINSPIFIKLKPQDVRDSWIEFYLPAGESHELGINFKIHEATTPPLIQDPIYYLEVVQYDNGERAGSVSFEILTETEPLPPPLPSNLTVQVLSSSSIKLNWVDNSNNEEAFILERSKSGGAYVHVANINADLITYTDSGLEPYTLYQYRLKAISNTGLSSSYIYSPQVRTLDAAPALPTNFLATLRSDCRVDLTWLDNASNEYRYELVRVLNGVSTTITTNILANSQYYLDYISISEAATYTYKIRARSATGLYSSYTTFDLVLLAPTIPNLVATPYSDGLVNLSWPGFAFISTYHLEKKVGSTWITLTNVSSLTQSYLDNQVSAGQNYEYRLRGRAGCIFSSYSTQSVSMPILPAPTNFVGTYNSVTNSISLTWTDNAQSENGYILERIPLGGSSSTFNLGANIIAHTDGNLGNYPSYKYRLHAKTALGVTSLIAETIIILPPTQVKVSGFIRNHFENSPVNNVTIELVSGNGSVLNQFITNITGYYEFMVDINSSFTIRPTKNTAMMNGVNLQDKALYEYYLSRGRPINTLSPYLLIAADVNGDCDVNIEDYYLITEATRLRNPVINFLVPSWQFVSSSYDVVSQGYCPFDQTRSYTNISTELINQDFIGIKSGDVTGDANPRQKIKTNNDMDESLLSLKVVPNPFSERTELLFESSVSTSVTICVYNTLGVEIYRKNVEVLKGLNSHTLSLKAAAGLYYVSVVGEGLTYTSKLVIEK